MTKRIKLAFALFLPLFAIPQLRAQDALVTFYMRGSELKTGLPGTNTGMYSGPVYDGKERLFTFYTGLVQRNSRFVTLRFSSGTHTFMTDPKHPSPKRSVALALKPGDHYYVSATSESRGIVVVELEHGLLTQVGCSVAQSSAAAAKPVELKRISKPILGRIVSETSFPGCS